MAELSTLARPYAKAAFDYAHENSAIGEWEDFLLVASAIVKDAAFEHMLKNPSVEAQKKAQLLVDIYNEQVTTTEVTPLKTYLFENSNDTRKDTDTLPAASTSIINFVKQLAEQERISLIPKVYEQFCLQRAETLQQVDAYVTTAYPLNNAQRVILQNRLEKSLNASVVIHETVDSSLLAGVTIKIGDKIVDDSVRGKLKQLKTQLTA